MNKAIPFFTHLSSESKNRGTGLMRPELKANFFALTRFQLDSFWSPFIEHFDTGSIDTHDCDSFSIGVIMHDDTCRESIVVPDESRQRGFEDRRGWRSSYFDDYFLLHIVLHCVQHVPLTDHDHAQRH